MSSAFEHHHLPDPDSHAEARRGSASRPSSERGRCGVGVEGQAVAHYRIAWQPDYAPGGSKEMSDNPRRGNGIGLQPWRILHVAAGVFLLLGVVPAIGACMAESYKLTLHPAKEKLADGTYIIGAVTTKHGQMEARVVVMNGIVSKPEFYIGNKQLREVSKENLPKSALSCLSKRFSLSISDRIIGAARSISEAIVPSAYAAKTCGVSTFVRVDRECATVNGETECVDVIERIDCGKHVAYYVGWNVF